MIIYGGIQQDGIILSVHTKTVDTSLKRSITKIFENKTFVRLEFYNSWSHRVAIQYGNILWIVLWPLSQNFSERKTLSRNSTRRKSGGSNGLKQGNQVFRGKSFQSLQPWNSFCELLVKSNGIFVKDMKPERFAMTCCTEEQSNQEGVDGENLVSANKTKTKPFLLVNLGFLWKKFGWLMLRWFLKKILLSREGKTMA